MQLCTMGKRKPYEAPAIRSRQLSQAVLFLVGRAYLGDVGARDLLALLFPETSDTETLFPKFHALSRGPMPGNG